MTGVDIGIVCGVFALTAYVGTRFTYRQAYAHGRRHGLDVAEEAMFEKGRELGKFEGRLLGDQTGFLRGYAMGRVVGQVETVTGVRGPDLSASGGSDKAPGKDKPS